MKKNIPTRNLYLDTILQFRYYSIFFLCVFLMLKKYYAIKFFFEHVWFSSYQFKIEISRYYNFVIVYFIVNRYLNVLGKYSINLLFHIMLCT